MEKLFRPAPRGEKDSLEPSFGMRQHRRVLGQCPENVRLDFVLLLLGKVP